MPVPVPVPGFFAGKFSELGNVQTERDDEWHSLDSTINRAHQHAAGGQGGRHRKG